MCVHEKVLTAGRNAVVGLTKHFGVEEPRLAKTIEAYDSLLLKTEDFFCLWCIEDSEKEFYNEKPDLGNLLVYISSYVDTYTRKDEVSYFVWEE